MDNMAITIDDMSDGVADVMNWRQASSLREELLFQRSFVQNGISSSYNGNPVIIPHWTIRVLVSEQSLRKYLGAVSGPSRQQIMAVCYASGISKMFMQVIYEFNDTVF